MSIHCYTVRTLDFIIRDYLFTAPREVDRELYFIFTNILPDYEEIEFPAPREVDR